MASTSPWDVSRPLRASALQSFFPELSAGLAKPANLDRTTIKAVVYRSTVVGNPVSDDYARTGPPSQLHDKSHSYRPVFPLCLLFRALNTNFLISKNENVPKGSTMIA